MINIIITLMCEPSIRGPYARAEDKDKIQSALVRVERNKWHEQTIWLVTSKTQEFG